MKKRRTSALQTSLAKPNEAKSIDIVYSKSAEIFIEKNAVLIDFSTSNQMLQKAMRNILHIEQSNIDLKKLKGMDTSTYRVRKGNIRIIFRYENGEIIVVHVETIDFRGNVY
jgi:mRNA-degrading endonuclease RelE of RelBE toxin-antitoxin system